MGSLLELKTNIISFVEKYELYVKSAAKFVLMLAAFFVVHVNLCYYSAVDNVIIPIMLSVLCAIIPMSFGVFFLEVYILINLLGLGIEVVGVVAIVFAIVHLLYFRFAKGTIYRGVLAPVLAYMKIPYILPITCGLKGSPGSIVAVLAGMVVHALLSGIKQNEAVFIGTAEVTATDKLILLMNQITKNKELFVILFAFFLTTVLVYSIRRLSIKNAWRTASIIGIAFNMVVTLCGKLLIGVSDGILWLLIGSALSIGVAIIYEFIFMNLDYTRVEQVQFEDDNYYYYVKAVPKIMVQAQQKSVKRFNQTQEDSEESKERLAKELEIDRSLLK